MSPDFPTADSATPIVASSRSTDSLEALLHEVRACQLCAGELPFDPKPVLRASKSARILIVGQAPGTKVHASGIPWDDKSGDRLRDWMNVSRETFYDESRIAIIPMGLCYPGKGKSGDLPPRRECAPRWHEPLLKLLPNIECTLLIGQYAQKHYLRDRHKSLTERVRHWQDYAPRYWVTPHPSPRNIGWRMKNPWFEEEVTAAMREHISACLNRL